MRALGFFCFGFVLFVQYAPGFVRLCCRGMGCVFVFCVTGSYRVSYRIVSCRVVSSALRLLSSATNSPVSSCFLSSVLLIIFVAAV